MESEETLDYIIRSRPTILEILRNRGYDTSAHEGISPAEIRLLATTSANLLKMEVKKVSEPSKRVVVLYWVESSFHHKAEKEVEKNWDEENAARYEPENDELLIVLNEPMNEAFHTTAKRQWASRKARVNFYGLKNLLSNPARHRMVPPHRLLTVEEADVVKTRLHMKSKSEFAHIKFHEDIQARVLGLVPGDVVEITRPSETAGISTTYRICSA
jgi:DNA-directed RNA polymerase subunit H (RpoH/RPB5)